MQFVFIERERGWRLVFILPQNSCQLSLRLNRWSASLIRQRFWRAVGEPFTAFSKLLTLPLSRQRILESVNSSINMFNCTAGIWQVLTLKRSYARALNGPCEALTYPLIRWRFHEASHKAFVNGPLCLEWSFARFQLQNLAKSLSLCNMHTQKIC